MAALVEALAQRCIHPSFAPLSPAQASPDPQTPFLFWSGQAGQKPGPEWSIPPARLSRAHFLLAPTSRTNTDHIVCVCVPGTRVAARQRAWYLSLARRGHPRRLPRLCPSCLLHGGGVGWGSRSTLLTIQAFSKPSGAGARKGAASVRAKKACSRPCTVAPRHLRVGRGSKGKGALGSTENTNNTLEGRLPFIVCPSVSSSCSVVVVVVVSVVVVVV